MNSFRTKSRKRTLSMILTVLMVFTVMNPALGLFPITRAEAAAEVKTSGNFRYTVSGTTATIVGYTGSEASVTIPDKIGNNKVTTIGQGVFSPATFYDKDRQKHLYKKITSVTIPEGVTTINEGAFYRNTSIKKVTFPTTLTTIGSYAFTGCTSLGSIKIPAKTTTIGNYAFCECSGLTGIVVDSANSTFTSGKNSNALIRKNSKGDILIQGCKNTVIPSSVTTIRDQAFACIPLKGVFTVPYGVLYIGDKAFIDNEGMTGIVIASSVKAASSKANDDFDYTFGYMYDKSDIFQEWIGTYNDICVYGPIMNTEFTAYTHEGNPIEDEYIFFELGDQFPVVNIEFNDVWNPDTFYFDAVKWGKDKKIIEGYDDETFRPDATCTRSQMVTFLWRMANRPKSTIKNPFKDVTNTSAYYYEAMLWAYENKILEGTKKSDGLYFNPTGTCTRQQAVTFMWRAANKPNPKNTKSNFTDVQDPNAYFYKAVLWASEKGITEGTKLSNGTYVFKPTDNCARRQMVTFLYRYSKKK